MTGRISDHGGRRDPASRSRLGTWRGATAGPIKAVLIGLSLWATVSASAGPGAAALRIAYVDWSSSVASAHVVCAVLQERIGQDCELIQTTGDEMWRMVAEGEADAMLSAWLPSTHADYLATYGEQLDDLGPNLEGTRTGLVVPATGVGRQTNAAGARALPGLDIQGIAELADHGSALGNRIVGIDPEAGVMSATERALKAYDLTGFRLVAGSEAEMTRALAAAIAGNQPIVVTGWVPHWMFGRWALRFLDDPKQVFGTDGAIHTMTRKGLAQDAPKAQRLLDRFQWNSAQMERLLVWIHQDQARDPYAQAMRWLRANPETVDQWVSADADP